MTKFTYLILLSLCIFHPASAQLSQQSITGSRVKCVNHLAADHACSEIDLLARLSKNDLDAESGWINDIWGWTDSLKSREYALVGTGKSVVFVDVTDPVNPVRLGKLPGRTSESNDVLWRDIKVYKDHMFVTVDGEENGMQVFDLHQLRTFGGIPKDFKESAHYDGISKAHNLAINEESGFAYITGYQPSSSSSALMDTCKGRGLHIVDIREPINPVYAGCFADPSTGNRRDGYTHDAQCVIYRGPDVQYRGREICIGSNETHISIADVTDKSNPVPVGAATYPQQGYTHQGWLTDDHRYFLMNDEFDEVTNPEVKNTRTIIWDLTDLEDPRYHSSFFYPTENPDHNLYVHGNYMYAANYTTGLRIVDISEIDKPREIAFFDTHPKDDDSNFGGAWSSFRFQGSGTTIVSSDPAGLLILDPVTVTITYADEPIAIPESFSLSATYPNPFKPSDFNYTVTPSTNGYSS